MNLHRGRAVVIAASLLAAVTVAGCQSTPPAPAAPTTELQPNQVGTATRGPDPVASQEAGAPVKRPQALPADERATAETANFDDDVVFSDGLTVAITDVARGSTEGRGPGEIAGEKFTVLTVSVTNNSKKDVDTSRVVAAVTYGNDPIRTARPVYTEETRDLTGTVKPGASQTATYAFAITDDGLADVTLTLDIDGRHGQAVFAGSLD